MPNDEYLWFIVHATLTQPRGYTHRNETVRSCRLKTIDISREDTEIGQEHAWLLQPKRGGRGAAKIGRRRRVAGAEEAET